MTGIRPLFPIPSATPEAIDLRKILDPALLGLLVVDLLLIIGLILRG